MHPNEELFRRLLKVWGSGDREAAVRFFAEDAVFHHPGPGPLQGGTEVVRGSSGSGPSRTGSQVVGSGRSSWVWSQMTGGCTSSSGLPTPTRDLVPSDRRVRRRGWGVRRSAVLRGRPRGCRGLFSVAYEGSL
jgi:hypothetical protein